MPMGWNDMSGTRRPPMRETRPPKMGTAEAMMYEMRVIDATDRSQVVQCVFELEVRCFEPRRMRTKRSFAGNWGQCAHRGVMRQLTWVMSTTDSSTPGSAKP
jgi:hypothetical protein